MLEEPAHHLAVDGLLAGVDDALQEEVALLQLVVEEQVALAEDKVFCAEFFHGAASQDVQACEEPAATTALLVGDTRILYLDAEVLVLSTGILLINGHLSDANVADGVTQCFLSRSSGVAALQLFKHLRRDARLCVEQRAEAHSKRK